MDLDPITVSVNHRFLMTDKGEPFFWLGDTAWELFHRMTLKEVDFYLRVREQQKFTLIQAVALAEMDGLNTPNAYGELPFKNSDPSQPNESYWEFVDEIIKRAYGYNLYVGLLPTWGDKVAEMWGEGPKIFNEMNSHQYGEWLGERYKEYPNIIWVLGGDRPVQYIGMKSNQPEDDLPIWRGLALGIRKGFGTHCLMTYHPSGGHSSSEYIHQEEWLDINMMQSGHGSGHDAPVWDMIQVDYEMIPTKPTLDGEPNYEDHPVNPWPEWDPDLGYYDDYDVRKQLYRSVFSGGCGVTYGHHSVWQMCSDKYEGINHTLMSWQDAIDRPGANQVRHLRALMESRPYFDRIPDQSLLMQNNIDNRRYKCATKDKNGRYAFVYLPVSEKVVIDVGKLDAGQVNAWWFSPSSGDVLLDGKYAGGDQQVFYPPEGGSDWVLVLDDAACDFMRPGDSLYEEDWRDH